MKRYDHYGTLDGGGPAEAIEEPDGDWVRYADAQAAISAAVAAERERWRAAAQKAEEALTWVHGGEPLPTLEREALDMLRALLKA